MCKLPHYLTIIKLLYLAHQYTCTACTELHYNGIRPHHQRHANIRKPLSSHFERWKHYVQHYNADMMKNMTKMSGGQFYGLACWNSDSWCIRYYDEIKHPVVCNLDGELSCGVSLYAPLNFQADNMGGNNQCNVQDINRKIRMQAPQASSYN